MQEWDAAVNRGSHVKSRLWGEAVAEARTLKGVIGKAWISFNRLLVEVWMFRALLLKTQK